MNTPIYNSALWACLKGGQWQNTVDLFDIMDKKGRPVPFPVVGLLLILISSVRN